MSIRKNRKLPRSVLPGLKASPAAEKQVGITSRSRQSRGGAGRLGLAMRDASSTDSATPPPKKQNTRARAVARWENEGGRTPKAAVVAGSTKKSSATKPVRSASAQRAKKPLNAKVDSASPARGAKKAFARIAIGDVPRVDSASPARGTKKGPRDSLLLGNAKQREAEARVKNSRIKQAGLESRLLGHVSGSGRRAQARRDSKN